MEGNAQLVVNGKWMFLLLGEYHGSCTSLTTCRISLWEIIRVVLCGSLQWKILGNNP
jgi:hypothetical protein